MPRWIDAARAELETREHELAYRRTIDGVPPPELPGLDADAARQRARDRFVRSRRPILDGQLSELRALDGLDTSTALVRRDTVIADLHGTRLVFEGKELRFPERLSAELEFLVTAEAPFAGAISRARSTMQDASCCSDGSCARGSCDVAPRPPELLRRAGEVRRLAVLAPDLDVVLRPPASTRARQPSRSGSISATRTSATPSSPVASRTARSAACAANPWHERPR